MAKEVLGIVEAVVVVVVTARAPLTNLLLGEGTTADVGLGAPASDTLSERAPDLGGEARSERLGKFPALRTDLEGGGLDGAGRCGRDGERARQQEREDRGSGREGPWGGHRSDGLRGGREGREGLCVRPPGGGQQLPKYHLTKQGSTKLVTITLFND